MVPVLLAASLIAPPIVSLGLNDGALVTYGADGSEVSRFAGFEAESLGLSSSAQWAAGLKGDTLHVQNLAQGRSPRVVQSGVRRFEWAPRGAMLAFLTQDKKLATYPASSPSEAPVTLASQVQSFAWSPDGSRIVACVVSPQGPQLRLFRLGENRSRSILDGREASELAWSPDGRRLAFLKPVFGAKGRFDLVTGLLGSSQWKQIATVDAAQLAWSPDSRRLAVMTKAGATVWFLGDQKPVATTLKFSEGSHLQWVKSDRLELFDGEARWRVDLTGKRERVCDLKPRPKAGVYARSRDIDLDASLLAGDPLRGTPLPARGKNQLVGAIVDFDPIENEITAAIETLRDPQGNETNFAQTMTVVMALTSTSRILGTGETGLLAQDLPLDQPTVFQVDGPVVEGRPLPLDWVTQVLATEGAVLPSTGFPKPTGLTPEHDRVVRDRIVVPIVYPLLGDHKVADTFLASRGNGTRRHLGQDLMGAKMRPVVAIFDGTIQLGRNKGNAGHTITLRNPSGWTAQYYHMNNDNPGTNDGAGGDLYAFAPGIVDGTRVVAGQFIGYLGNSGNAETTAPHIHFEIWYSPERIVINAHPSLMAAKRLRAPVYPLPVPFLTPSNGQTRIDSVVRSTDLAGGSLSIQRIATLKPGGTPSVELAPRLETLLVSSDTKIRHRLHDGISLNMNDLRPGQLATVMVGNEQPNQAIFASIETR